MRLCFTRNFCLRPRYHLSQAVALLLLGLVFVCPALGDAEVNLEVQPSSGTVEDVFTLTVSLSGSDAGRVQAPTFEENEHFTISSSGVSRGTTITNGSISSNVSFIFSLTPNPDLKPGTYPIPQGHFQLSSGDVPLRTPNIKILQETPSATASDLQHGNVSFVHVVDDVNPFVGQQLLYQVQLAATAQIIDADLLEGDFSGFRQESMGKPTEEVRIIGSQRTRLLSVRTAIFPTEPREVTIPPRILTAKVAVPRRQGRQLGGPFDSLFPGFTFEPSYDTVNKRYLTKPLPVTVRPLPPAPQKNLGYIPVGKVELTSSINKQDLRQGDTATWIVTLTGDANLRPYELKLPANLERNFKIYQDQPAVTTSVQGPKLIFQKKFSIALVPKATGEVELPSLEVVTFDPESVQYQTLYTESVKLFVTPDDRANDLVVKGLKPTEQLAVIDAPPPTLPAVIEDLRPQHTGPEAGFARKQMGSTATWLLIVILPLTALTVRWYSFRQASLSANATTIRRRNAAAAARTTLGKLRVSSPKAVSDSLASVLREYLSDRFSVPGAGLTSNEVEELIGRETRTTSLRDQAHSLLMRLDRERFSGGLADNSEVSVLVDQTQNLIDAIEREAKR